MKNWKKNLEQVIAKCIILRKWNKLEQFIEQLLEEKDIKLCKYCGESIEIRNPTGLCDHLYYPENVNKDYKILSKQAREYILEDIIPEEKKIEKEHKKHRCNDCNICSGIHAISGYNQCIKDIRDKL